MIENGMVMPTNVNFNRARQRKVVFYGRVSTEHEAQLSALEIKYNGTKTWRIEIRIGMLLRNISTKESRERKRKSDLHF